MTAPLPPELPRLHRKQEIAIAAILEGATDTAAAKRARVTRETVNRWRHADADFVAELRRRRAELWASEIDHLRGLFPRAVDVLGLALDAEEWPVRLRAVNLMLQVLGVGEWKFAPPVSGVTRPEVEREWAEREESRKQSAALDALIAELPR